MKTSEAIRLAGGLGQLAAIFEITKSAVCQWPEEIPKNRLYELKDKRPQWFAEAQPEADRRRESDRRREERRAAERRREVSGGPRTRHDAPS